MNITREQVGEALDCTLGRAVFNAVVFSSGLSGFLSTAGHLPVIILQLPQ